MNESVRWQWRVLGKKKIHLLFLTLIQAITGSIGVAYALLLRSVVDGAVAGDRVVFWRSMILMAAAVSLHLILAAVYRWLLELTRASFENVQLLDLEGNPRLEVTFGQEVILRMVIKFHEDTPCLGIGYHIRNRDGVDLVYSDSRFSKVKAIFDAKRDEIYVVDWRFKVELRQELYNFACSISMPIEESLDSPDLCDFVPLAVQFKVVSPNKYLTLAAGYVHWHDEMKINKL